MQIVVIDAQGGGIGKAVVSAVSAVKERLREPSEIIAVGTNISATQAMLRAGADHAATGENAVIANCRSADVIIGPIGIVIADAMYGEITPKMAAAVGQSPATRLLIPVRNCYNYVAGVENYQLSKLVEETVEVLLTL